MTSEAVFRRGLKSPVAARANPESFGTSEKGLGSRVFLMSIAGEPLPLHWIEELGIFDEFG